MQDSKLDLINENLQKELNGSLPIIKDGNWIREKAFSSLPLFVALCVVVSEIIYLGFYLYLGTDYVYGFIPAFFIPLIAGYFLGKSRIKLTKRLADSNDRLQQLYKTSDQLLTILAHDVRGPVGSLIMLSEMVMDDSLSPEDAKKMISNVNEKSRHTLNVIDNLLSWITSQQAGSQPNAERFNMTELVVRELQAQTIGAELKNISVEKSLSDSIYAWGDAGMISTIIRNLLNNAVKFTELNGHINVYVGSNENRCILKISNSGDHLTNQNEDLSYVQQDIDKNIGFGLGLKLSKEYARQNECDLMLTRNDTGGATAKLSIQCASEVQ